VSRELHAGAVRLAANRDLVDPGREPVQEARQEFLAELEGVLARLNEIGRLDDTVLREVLDDDAR
jgi:glycerol-3-phosphate O-acyltransferase